MKIRKIISAFLIALMILSVFSACSGKDGGKESEVDGQISGTEENPNLPAVDYNGYEFTFLTGGNNSLWYDIDFLLAESETGETLNDAIYRRNALVEEKYNIKIRQTNVSDIKTEVRTQIMGGEPEFDAIVTGCARLATMAQENLLYNLLDIDTFHWDKSYWDKNSRDELLIGDKLYFCNCALNIDSIGFCVYFNKKILSDFQLTSPYEYIKNNEWTLDSWAEMVRSVSVDLNHDGAMTELDQFGTLAEHHNPRMFLYASGVRATTNDASGYPIVTLMDDADKTVGIYEKLKEVLSDTSVSYCMTCSTAGANGYQDKWGYLRYLYTQDHYLFYYSSDDALYANPSLAEMESEFGIVPFPKYNKAQDVFKTIYPYNRSLFAIPSIAKNINRTAAIIEDMNYFSSFTLIPAWYETLLSRRYARDDESEQFLGILRNNCVYDLGLYYNFGNIRSKILDVDFATNNISRNYSALKKTIDNAIKSTYQSFEKR